MKHILKIIIFSALLFTVSSCVKESPNLNKKGKDELKSHRVDHPVDAANMPYNDIIYVPIYSDIYVNEQNQKSLLSATLSIRNTSLTDSLFISKIDYYSTDGRLLKQFINETISLQPQGTINYVIEKEDDTGGSGADFVVTLSGSDENMKPLLQSIMIGENGKNQGFAFTAEGISIGNKSTK